MKQVLADKERVLGSERLDTVNTRIILALTYVEAGNLGRAIPLLQQALADSERVLGSDDSNTIGSRNGFNGAYRSAWHLGQTIPMLKQVLAESKKRQKLGGMHP